MVHPSWVRTPLTSLLTAEENKNFQQSVLDPRTISDAIVDKIVSGNSGQIVLPVIVTSYTNLRGWPSWMQETLRNEGTKMLKKAGGF